MPKLQTKISMDTSPPETRMASGHDQDPAEIIETWPRSFLPPGAENLLEPVTGEDSAKYPQIPNERDFYILAENLLCIGKYLERKGKIFISNHGNIGPMYRLRDQTKTMRVYSQTGTAQMTVDPWQASLPDKLISAQYRRFSTDKLQPVELKDIPDTVWLILASANEQIGREKAVKRGSLLARVLAGRK